MFKWFGHVNYTPCTRVAAFAEHLKDGRLMASRCDSCGARSFPPRADCEHCMGRAFSFVEISGRGVVHTFTVVAAPPTGFTRFAPYTIGVVDLEEGGRALAWFGVTIPADAIRIGMPVQVVPRIDEELEAIHVFYSLERPGTTWSQAPPLATPAHSASPATVWSVPPVPSESRPASAAAPAHTLSPAGQPTGRRAV